MYTQDCELRYSPSVIRCGTLDRGHSGPYRCGTDADGCGAAIIALKTEALATGSRNVRKSRLGTRAGVRWHDLHIEPLRNEAGDIVGLTCASVDMTERKEAEAHLRLLLRELTHRSKNLLAVIQAMGAPNGTSCRFDRWFLHQFGARLQALAASHDLLVREAGMAPR